VVVEGQQLLNCYSILHFSYHYFSTSSPNTIPVDIGGPVCDHCDVSTGLDIKLFPLVASRATKVENLVARIENLVAENQPRLRIFCQKSQYLHYTVLNLQTITDCHMRNEIA
jgi:hypothetical protein